ncbi:hypothetical protein AAHE18_20G204500 [Arachis hypogaea]
MSKQTTVPTIFCRVSGWLGALRLLLLGARVVLGLGLRGSSWFGGVRRKASLPASRLNHVGGSAAGCTGADCEGPRGERDCESREESTRFHFDWGKGERSR